MIPLRKILAFLVQSGLSFAFISVTALSGLAVPVVIGSYIVWASCVGVAAVPETIEELRKIRKKIDSKMPWY
jgi:hypothetical protein